MIKHILTLIWNRKRANGLIILEIAIAFLIVFVITLMIIANFRLYNEPLGFKYQPMWNVLFTNVSGPWEQTRDQAQLQQVVNLLKQQPEIEKVQVLKNPTFLRWRGSSSYEVNGQQLSFLRNYMDDGAPETFGMTLLQGRWFGPQDDGQNYEAVVVNRRFVERYFPNRDPIGADIRSTEPREGEPPRERRIVGVFEDFRQQGELNTLKPYVIFRYDMSNGGEIHNIELKMQPATSRAYEENLNQLLQQAAPNWEFTITPWKEKRTNALMDTIVPLILASVVAFFLMLMVAMGLFGVLWQNVTSRTQEIGIRRALGASKKMIHWQIIFEQLVVCAFGIAIATLILIQIPASGVFQELTWSLFWSAQSIAVLFMLALSLICAYYPGRLATAQSPADALHYE